LPSQVVYDLTEKNDSRLDLIEKNIAENDLVYVLIEIDNGPTFVDQALLLTLWHFFPMAICLPDEDWALALAREAVIRPLTSPNQSEMTEEFVVTASDELGISRSLVYLLVETSKNPDGSGRVREWKRRPDTGALH